MATPVGNSGIVGEYKAIIYQIDSSSDETDAGPCGLETRLHSLSPKQDMGCSQIPAPIPLLQFQLIINI